MIVDLNSDVSEGFGPYPSFEQSALYDLITSANIACGGHAGDPVLMQKTLKLCAQKSVQVGAHPGYRDLYGFGRRALQLTEEEAVSELLFQIGALNLLAKLVPSKVQYIKLHGAWYNSAMEGTHARAIIEAVQQVLPELAWLALSGSPFTKLCEERGVKVYHEVFADRAYNPDGTLVNRALPGAVIHDKSFAIDQVKRMVIDSQVKAIDGTLIPIKADSICLHGDNPQVVDFASQLRVELEAQGVIFRSFTSRSVSEYESKSK